MTTLFEQMWAGKCTWRFNTVSFLVIILFAFSTTQAFCEDIPVVGEFREYVSDDMVASILREHENDQMTSLQIIDVQLPESSESESTLYEKSYTEGSIPIKDVFITSVARGAIPPRNVPWEDQITLLIDPNMTGADLRGLNKSLTCSADALPLLLGPAEDEEANSIEYRARFFSRLGTLEILGQQYEFLEPYMCIVYATHMVVTR